MSTYPSEDTNQVAQERHGNLRIGLAHTANNVGEAVVVTKVVNELREVVRIVYRALRDT